MKFMNHSAVMFDYFWDLMLGDAFKLRTPAAEERAKVALAAIGIPVSFSPSSEIVIEAGGDNSTAQRSAQQFESLHHGTLITR